MPGLNEAPPAIAYAREFALPLAEFRDVVDSSGLRAAQQPCDDARLQAMLDGANLVVTARQAGGLVGVARCLTDFAWCCYLSDLAVCRPLQSRGIGRGLLHEVYRHVGDGVSVILMSEPSATGFYLREGMERVGAAFWRRRSR